MLSTFGRRGSVFSASAFLMAFTFQGAAAEPKAGSMDFVVTSLRTASYETPHLDECPEGVAVGNDEIWWKALSPRDRDRMTDGGAKEAAERRITATLRGPGGEDVCWNPTLVKDPPMRTIKGTKSFGLNLDNTSDGQATERTCRHQKFDSPDGTTRVDNQLYRLVGCIHGWRQGGYIEPVADIERRNSSQGVLLIQVTGITSPQQTADVKVRLYRAADFMPKDSTGSILPYASYRIDGNSRYGTTINGRVENGVLTTEPIDVHMPFYGNRVETEFNIRGMRLQLNLAPDKAAGLLAGYHDLENWWDYVRKMGYLTETAQFSCPALYDAARQLADGYPDPTTGECSALSVAYKVEAVRAFVIDNPKPNKVATATDRAEITFERLLPGFAIRKTPRGDVLTDQNGMTIYTPSHAECEKECPQHFQAIEAPWASVSEPQWAVHTHDNGLRQLSFNGGLIFTCTHDSKPGSIACDDANWRPVIVKHRAPLPPWMTVQPSELGQIIADRDGKSLYKLIGDLALLKKQICDEVCFKSKWRPLYADEAAEPVGNVRPVANDGERVWALNGMTLYTFADDDSPSEIAGHRFGGASVSTKNWFSAIRLEEATAPPIVKTSPEPQGTKP